MDGILYKGRMINQDGARPSTGMEKELAGEGYQAFRGAPTLNVLALLGSMRRCRWGSELAPSLTWGSSNGRRPSHGYLKKRSPTICQVLHRAPERQWGAKKDGLLGDST